MAQNISGHRTIGTRFKAFIGAFVETLAKMAMVTAPGAEDEAEMYRYLTPDWIDW
jgi:hypothetical protein